MASPKKTSLSDIARALNVSKTLVSMVLNGKGKENGINEDTQKRVWEKAKELNYKPNHIARLLRTGKSQTLGLIVSDISNSFYAKLCRAVEDYASHHGYHLFFGSSDEKPEREKELIQMLKERAVDGLIISSTLENRQVIQDLLDDQYPFVLIDRHFENLETPYVVVDNYRGGLEMTEHLAKLGHKRIGLLTISPSTVSTIQERARGYKDALKAAGVSYDPALVREIPFDDIQNAVAREVRDLVKSQKVTAIFATNNNLAIAALQVLNDSDLRVPQDVALAAFDDVELFRFSYPPVTTVAQPIEQIGRSAVDLLLKQIEDKEQVGKGSAVLQTQLVVRRSCGAHLNKL